MTGQGGHVSVRGGSHLRRGRGVRRASAGLSLTRLGVLAVLLGTVVMLDQAGSTTFAIRQVETRGAMLTDAAAAEAALMGIPPAQANVFRYDTAAAAARLATLPTVRRAEVRAILPDRLVAIVEERDPVLVWVAPAGRFLVDREGLLFAPADGREGALSAVIDERIEAARMAVGARLDAVDVAVARQLAAVTPGSIGSDATALVLRVTDSEGYVLAPLGRAWQAVFGMYGPILRPPTMAPLQVQCLAALLGERGEDGVARIVLTGTARPCGTFVEP